MCIARIFDRKLNLPVGAETIKLNPLLLFSLATRTDIMQAVALGSVDQGGQLIFGMKSMKSNISELEFQIYSIGPK